MPVAYWILRFNKSFCEGDETKSLFSASKRYTSLLGADPGVNAEAGKEYNSELPDTLLGQLRNGISPKTITEIMLAKAINALRLVHRSDSLL
jgi:hypothetical protein